MSLFPTQTRPLACRKPFEGRDYWVVDQILPNADEVRARCLTRTDWEMGYPCTGEVWPGMRSMPALLDDELVALDARVCQLTGAKKYGSSSPNQAPGSTTIAYRWSVRSKARSSHTPIPRTCAAMPP